MPKRKAKEVRHAICPRCGAQAEVVIASVNCPKCGIVSLFDKFGSSSSYNSKLITRDVKEPAKPVRKPLNAKTTLPDDGLAQFVYIVQGERIIVRSSGPGGADVLLVEQLIKKGMIKRRP